MKKVLLLIIVFLLGIINVYALEGNVTSITIKEKSSTIIVEEPSVTNNNIDAKVTFKNVGDYVIFTLGLDIDFNLYTIESVIDNNESEHIKTTYEVVEDKIEMKLEYKSALTTSMDLDDIEITINLKDKDGNNETLIVNPGTGDNIVKYLTILGISTLTLTGLILLRKKKTVLGVILLIAIVPTVVIAEDKMKLNVELSKDDIKVGYDVVFNGGTGATGNTDTKLCYFEEECTLPANDFEKENSNFAGWAIEVDGEVVYLDEAGVSNLAPGGEYELFAVWNELICKKVTDATQLHAKTCNNTNTYGCNATGQVGNGNTITYGTLVSGSPKAGDAYDCKVTSDGGYTERFYYVGSDGNNSILIYYKNINNQSTYAYDLSGQNWHGPTELYQYLPSTDEWNNPGLIVPGTRQIVTEDGTTSTTGGILPGADNEHKKFEYTGKAARFLTTQELLNACTNISSAENYSIGDLDSCNWLMENVGYFEIGSGSIGYWLENPRSSVSNHAWCVDGYSRIIYRNMVHYTTHYGVRPVITIKTSDLG